MCRAFPVQSQPCHWRNIKSVTKRDVSSANKTIASEVADGKKEKSVSDNISLFQSLRVLQEGEGDEFSSAVQSKYYHNLASFCSCPFSRHFAPTRLIRNWLGLVIDFDVV